MKLHVLLLTALPLCLGQFSIQGPTDGNRQAQGLKYSEEKGIEYTDQSASLGAGDFTIQGATDGNSNFRIQGATDGHSNFQIQGPTSGGADAYNVPSSAIQGAYDANQAGANALQYSDPSGLRVNWRSYGHDRQSRVNQPQAEPQYVQPAAAPPPRRAARPQTQHQAQPQPQIPQANYKPYESAPNRIKELLQFQQQIPYINIIPEQFRYDALAAAQAQAQQVQSKLQQEAQQLRQSEPEYRPRSRGPSRQRRQAPQQQYRQQSRAPQYQRISQPPAEPAPQYSTNVPTHLQELLKYQAQIPHNIIANQIQYRLEKPYVPQPVQPSAPAQGQGSGAQYQYEGQASGYTQAQLGAYNRGQPVYGQAPGSVRPVTENQY